MDSDLQERVVAALVLAVGEIEAIEAGELDLAAAGEGRRSWSALLTSDQRGVMVADLADEWDEHPDHLERVQVREVVATGIAIDREALSSVLDEVRRHRIQAGLPAIDCMRGAAELGLG